MPHGESWFSFLPNYEALLHAAHALGPNGQTLIGHAHIGIQHVLGSIFIALLCLFVGIWTFVKVKDPKAALVPEGKLTLRTFMELFVGYVYRSMADMMGKDAARFFLPLIGTCAVVIFFSNVLGLIPGFLPPTDNPNTTFAMAIVIFATTHVFGVKEQGLVNYVKHFMGPKWYLAPLMFPIELISHMARPLTLAIRLAANMTADHLVLTIFIGMAAGFPMAWSVFIPIPLPLYFMGCIVVTVQTLVFCLLSTVYISMAIAHSDHH